METSLTVEPYDYAAAERLSAELGVSHVVAQVLVRRGMGDVRDAQRFLEGADAHPLDAFGGLRAGAAHILGHVGRRSRITVHGDYDVDGVAATAVLVRALRTLGADVDWYLPSRVDDGYGLAAATVERLAARGTDLLVTVDCAITAVEEVAAARAAGLDVVVTDHHTPRADGALPDAPIVHPRLGGNPCPDLCATAVAHKLAQALLEAAGEDPAAADEDLDLVALATVADVVPLLGENRRLVRAGLRALARTRKPGLRALMEVSRVDPGTVDASAIGFRLAPRINAAGRLHRADAGLELLLTEDPARARAIAAELDATNAERRDVETRILFAAEAQVAEYGPQAAYVLAADDWHPGVIGIVAARIAERHHRPAVLIALDGDEGTGSGRSIPAFDLLGGLTAASRHLERYGGHRAAAGCTIARDDVDAFREAFAGHAAAVLTPDDLVPEQRIDAIAPGDALTLGAGRGARAARPVRPGQPAGVAARPGGPRVRPAGAGGGAPRRLRPARRRRPVALRAVRLQPGARRPGRAGRRGGAPGGQSLERRGGAAAGPPPRAAEPPGADRRDRRTGLRRRPAARAGARSRCLERRAGRRAARGAPRDRHRRPADRSREHGRAGARRRRPRAAPRADAPGPHRRLRDLLVVGARGRPGARRSLRPRGGGRPSGPARCAWPARTLVLGPSGPSGLGSG